MIEMILPLKIVEGINRSTNGIFTFQNIGLLIFLLFSYAVLLGDSLKNKRRWEAIANTVIIVVVIITLIITNLMADITVFLKLVLSSIWILVLSTHIKNN